jgi:hypothetical protein
MDKKTVFIGGAVVFLSVGLFMVWSYVEPAVKTKKK